MSLPWRDPRIGALAVIDGRCYQGGIEVTCEEQPQTFTYGNTGPVAPIIPTTLINCPADYTSKYLAKTGKWPIQCSRVAATIPVTTAPPPILSMPPPILSLPPVRVPPVRRTRMPRANYGGGGGEICPTRGYTTRAEGDSYSLIPCTPGRQVGQTRQTGQARQRGLSTQGARSGGYARGFAPAAPAASGAGVCPTRGYTTRDDGDSYTLVPCSPGQRIGGGSMLARPQRMMAPRASYVPRPARTQLPPRNFEGPRRRGLQQWARSRVPGVVTPQIIGSAAMADYYRPTTIRYGDGRPFKGEPGWTPSIERYPMPLFTTGLHIQGQAPGAAPVALTTPIATVATPETGFLSTVTDKLKAMPTWVWLAAAGGAGYFLLVKHGR